MNYVKFYSKNNVYGLPTTVPEMVADKPMAGFVEMTDEDYRQYLKDHDEEIKRAVAVMEAIPRDAM